MKPHAHLLVALVATASAVVAQDTETLHVTVSAVSGSSLYFDVGRTQGIATGMEVELQPPTGASFRATIREVSSRSCRAEVPLGFDVPPVGTPGQIDVPAGRSRRQGEEPKRAGEAPAHAPWTAGPQTNQDPNAPLLAPAFGGGPSSRPTSWHGRIFAQVLGTHDGSSGRGVDTYRARLGTRMDVDNLFGLGGRLAFDGEVTRRSLDLFAASTETDDTGRIDQLSYAWGDDEQEAWRIQFGRFVSPNTPQLGLLDGVEVLHRLDREWSIGVGLGFAPLPFPDRMSGDDVDLDLFATWRPRDSSSYATIGVQKTWHKGSADRDLLFGQFGFDAGSGLRVDGAAKIDLYTSRDNLESSSVELTEAWASVNWRTGSTLDLGLNVSTHRWPQLLREDYAFLPVELISDGHVERISPRIGIRVTDNLRVTGRVDAWQDQDRSGTGGEVGFDVNDLFDAQVNFAASLFYSDGAYQSGPGLRARASRWFDWGSAGLRAEWMSYDVEALVTGTETFSMYRVGLDVDFDLGSRWSAMLDGELVFGDQQDGYYFGVFVQKRL
ncbi:MAG: hypothetical protein U1F36_21640 [Planctomycetota bacterium]